MSNIYVVIKGHKTGIYRSEKRFLQQITDYCRPHYKIFSASDKNKAISYFRFHQQKKKPQAKGNISYYIDGSLHARSSRYAYAFVQVHETSQRILITQAKAEKDREFVRDMNIQGVEIKACMEAITHAIAHKHTHINIWYDNVVVRSVLAGKKKSTHPFYQTYQHLVQEAKINHGLTITFCKIKSHSGNVYHDQADQLARETMRNMYKKTVA